MHSLGVDEMEGGDDKTSGGETEVDSYWQSFSIVFVAFSHEVSIKDTASKVHMTTLWEGA